MAGSTAQERTVGLDTAEARRWRSLAVAVLAIVALLGGGQAWFLLGEQESRSAPTRYPASVTSVELDLQDASASVRGNQAGELTVVEQSVWLLNRPQVQQTVVGHTLRISAHCPRVMGIAAPGCSATLELRVPSATAVTLRTTSGQAAISDLTGNLSLRGTSGRIALDNDSGRIAAHLTSGQLVGRYLGATVVQAAATSGSLDLEFAATPDEVTLSTTSGEARVAVPPNSHYRVLSTLGSGSSDIDPALMDPRSPHAITMTAGSGYLTAGFLAPGGNG
ncbi:hypothetical protein GCM10009665_02110 [Kitasatospora nipponensis]|uniref:DUF4097 domain-containing protein n=1 Tax=Kitasatospora nipponensis TaxID=258049 RepID=A0ABP4GEU7_9ACTN